MKARLDADKAAAGGGRDPIGAGKPAPDQDVTYSYQGLMGTHGNLSVREDQLAPLVAQFDDHCRNGSASGWLAEGLPDEQAPLRFRVADRRRTHRRRNAARSERAVS